MGTIPGATAPDYSFYHNQLAHSNSFLLVNSPTVNSCFVTVDNLHTVKSREPLFYQFMKNWKLRLIEQSIAIGPNAKRDRNKFFNHIEKQLAVFEKKINKHLKG